MTISRRGAVVGGLGAGVAVPFLAACGAGGSDSDSSGSASSSATTSSAAPSSASASESASGSGSRTAVPALTATSAIKVGSGKIFGDENVVVTQPSSGTFKAFDATCTHKGCTVSEVVDKEIVCTCHFSKFSISDGSVESGPAPSPLSEIPITVDGGEIYLS